MENLAVFSRLRTKRNNHPWRYFVSYKSLYKYKLQIWCKIWVRGGEGNGTPLQYSCLKIPWTEKPGALQSMGSLRVKHDWATSLSLFTFMHWRRKWQPTPVFLPGESQGRGSLVAAVYGVTQSRTWLKWLSSSMSERGRVTVVFFTWGSLSCFKLR